MKSRHFLGKLLGGVLATALVLGSTGLAHATTPTATLCADGQIVVSGNCPAAIMGGTVFNDLNKTGVLNTGDPGLAGWTVDIIGSGSIIASTTTNSSGVYSFNLNGLGNPYVNDYLDPIAPNNNWTPTLSATSSLFGSTITLPGLELINSTSNEYDLGFYYTATNAPSPSATPEPSTLALFGTGALLLGGMALRRKALNIRT